MSSVSDVSHLDDKQSLDGSPTTENFKPFRPSLAKSNVKRASSVFGSFRGLKLPTEDDEPLSASSTRSNVLGEYLGEEIRDRQVFKTWRSSDKQLHVPQEEGVPGFDRIALA